MKRRLALPISGTILCLAACLALAEPPSYFYKAKVILRTGATLTTASYGLAAHFPDAPVSKSVKSVQLSLTPDYVLGHFTYSGERQTTTYRFPIAQLANKKLCVFPDYQVFNTPQYPHDFYWIKEETQIPMKNILRVETIRVIGKGYTIIDDPAIYADVKEPFIMIEDCETGCPGKLFSEDESITKDRLKELWDQRLACGLRKPETGDAMSEVLSKYRLQMAFDPFCVK
jgi:hypothetical protein